MILVPHESVARLHDPTPSTTETQLSALDNEMELIMRKKYADDSLKWKLYNEALQRYLHFNNERKKPAVLINLNMPGNLGDVYHEPADPASYGTAWKLWDATGEKKEKITKYLQGEDAYTLHKPARRRFPRNVTYADNIDESWQTDLTDFQSLKKDNDGFSYILCVIDVFSKFAWAVPIKDKSGPSIIKGFQTIFKTTDRRPTRLFSDKGKEYINKTFQKFLKENNITYIHTHNPDIKCSIVERWQRTIKSKLFKRFTYTEKYRYVDGLLDDIVDAYNHTYHRSIKMRPVDVTPDRVLETELAQRMELHGHWQAALIELHYPNTIAQVLEGENEITIMSDTFVDTVSAGGGQYYAGSSYQKGHGIGSWLGGLFRTVLPLLKSGATAVGREAARAGAHVLADVASGDTFADSAKRHTGEAVQNLKRKAASAMNGSGRAIKRPKPAPRRHTVAKARSVRNYPPDCFT
ncbi:Putative uncharacterized transposon-derived protein [Frankliniella fusca]|uniref:Uncharacterized transposon-derived protein n=1 Tax=Frankliniella fusca TaxID=407009 RepID=A0AAE1HXT2_9NEOP|nr:Putative uncharacterized transposon-derived protein [Frankliniella fusca]